MPRYVRVLDSAVETPRVADTLAQWVDVDDLIEIPDGRGITNSAPVGAINGVNQVFVFTSPPKAVFFQGRLQDEGVDYTLEGATVTFTFSPVDGTVKGFI